MDVHMGLIRGTWIQRRRRKLKMTMMKMLWYLSEPALSGCQEMPSGLYYYNLGQWS
jgi:hypothetical protein